MEDLSNNMLLNFGLTFEVLLVQDSKGFNHQILYKSNCKPEVRTRTKKTFLTRGTNFDNLSV